MIQYVKSRLAVVLKRRLTHIYIFFGISCFLIINVLRSDYNENIISIPDNDNPVIHNIIQSNINIKHKRLKKKEEYIEQLDDLLNGRLTSPGNVISPTEDVINVGAILVNIHQT